MPTPTPTFPGREVQAFHTLEDIIRTIKEDPRIGDYRVYVEKQFQDVIRPCFWVQIPFTRQDKQMRERYKRRYGYHITFLPTFQKTDDIHMCIYVGEVLYELFRKGTVQDARWEIQEAELHFTFNLDFELEWKDPVQAALMGTLTTKEYYKLKNNPYIQGGT